MFFAALRALSSLTCTYICFLTVMIGKIFEKLKWVTSRGTGIKFKSDGNDNSEWRIHLNFLLTFLIEICSHVISNDSSIKFWICFICHSKVSSKYFIWQVILFNRSSAILLQAFDKSFGLHWFPLHLDHSAMFILWNRLHKGILYFPWYLL